MRGDAVDIGQTIVPVQLDALNALAPESKARFESKSYGFRPDRGCHDATEAIFTAVGGKNPHRRWSLDAALAAVFDRIDHAHLLRQLGTFPEEQIKQWLKPGVAERKQLTSTEARRPPAFRFPPNAPATGAPVCGVEALGDRRHKEGRRRGRIIPRLWYVGSSSRRMRDPSDGAARPPAASPAARSSQDRPAASVGPDQVAPAPFRGSRGSRLCDAAAAGVRGKVDGASVLATVRLVPVEFLTEQHGHRLR
ncbi:reverse transcriptase domain-containing protein [Streptomyces sp. SA15]|uniref:reverse transcriptase domain-containing protein n=1 Tax=Streptomyces sp. SA15 TaxID=934019 RepID=UPI000D198CA1|nr:reverse transcriptase domain-containing protein [Streptomyces sp. SA15]